MLSFNFYINITARPPFAKEAAARPSPTTGIGLSFIDYTVSLYRESQPELQPPTHAHPRI